jgi:hypothetical protein
MLGIVQAHFDNVVGLTEFSLAHVTVQSSERGDSPNLTSRNAFESPFQLSQKDYCVQSATNLSPPQV